MTGFYLHPNSEQEIIDTSEEDIIVTNHKGIIVKASKISGKHYGIDPIQLLGRSVYELEKEGVFSPAITPSRVALAASPEQRVAGSSRDRHSSSMKPMASAALPSLAPSRIDQARAAKSLRPRPATQTTRPGERGISQVQADSAP